MIDSFMNGDLVITTNSLKNKLIKKTSNKLLNIKFMTLSEFKESYFCKYNEETIYYLFKKYGYKYDILKNMLDNIWFLDNLKQELIDNNLLELKNINMNQFKRIVLYNINVDKYIKEELSKYNLVNITENIGSYTQNVHKFDSIDDEISFVAIKILNILNKIDINDINLVNVQNEYIIPIKRIFKLYNIPINIDNKSSIYGITIVQNFITELNNSDDIESVVSNIPDCDIKKQIINIINKYRFKNIDYYTKYLIIEELKRIKLKSNKYKNAVSVCDIDCIDSNGYYFILGFNEGIIPKIYVDDDYLSDLKKQNLGILTSLDKNKYEIENIKSKLFTYENITVTYKLQTPFNVYMQSRLISDFQMKVIENNILDYNYSDDYNKYTLARKLDKLIKFNEISSDLPTLYNNYKTINYKTYNNKYTKINNDLFKEYINKKLLLSYSSIDNYNRCGFRYYISNILKLDKYEETFMTYIGNLFHYILSISNSSDFDFESSFSNYIKNKEFTSKEKFFINKLKLDLKNIIEVIRNQDNYSSLTESLYEQKIYIDKSRDIKITFMGVIDKLKYKDIGSANIVAIIDYKTGNPIVDINSSIYGIEMQLPIYLYLARNYKLSNVVIGGFYLQKIIPNKVNFQIGCNATDEIKKSYKLEGYSNSDTNYLNYIDSSYENSKVIKGMKTTSNGFSCFTKVLSNEEIDKLYNIVDSKIEQAIDNIMDTNFDINPKKIGDKLKGCEWCKFKDLCYIKNEDIVNLNSINYKEFLGGEYNA